MIINGESVSTYTVELTYGEVYGTLPIPAREGYTFAGWYTSSSNGDPVISSSIVTAITSKTIYAHWEANAYPVIFNANGGYGSETTSYVTYGEKYGILPTPERANYKFLGWYTQAQDGSKKTSSSTVNIVETQTLYAHWRGVSSIVSFDANGGYTSDSSNIVYYNETYGTLPTPSQTGYRFHGWYTQASGGILITEDDVVNITSDTTLYAHWKQEVYTVTFSANGGSVSPTSTTVTIGDTYSDFPTPTKEGYTFAGWYTKASSSGTRIYYTTVADTLYAHWTANEYTVYFDANGGNVSQSSAIVKYKAVYGTLPTPTRNNYTFSGWYTTASGVTKKLATSTVTNAENHTLYAHWTGIKSKLSYDSNGGKSITSTKTITYGSTYSTLSTPSRTGYTFDGWFTSVAGGTQITTGSIVETVTAQTLHAHWTVATPTITFNAYGGRVIENGLKVSTTKIIKTYGVAYGELPEASKTGYTFNGWFTSTTGSTQITASNIVTVTTSDTLYAHWTGITNTVHFDANGGDTATASMTVCYGAEYGTLPTPTLYGYDFTGWYTSAIGGTKVTASTTVELLDSQTLYAHWEIATYKVKYNGNGGTFTIDDKTYSATSRTVAYGGTYGSSYGILPTPSYSSHILEGWYTQEEGGTQINISTDFTTNAAENLYAHWRAKNIYVTLSENGGDPLSTILNLSYGSTYGTLPTTVLANHSFVGWFTTSSGSTQITKDSIMKRTSAFIIYAHWLADTYNVSFDANGGSVDTSGITVTYEDTYGTLPTPTRSYYSFGGWYTARSGGTKITSSSKVTISSDTVLYAHWTKEAYKVTFNANGGSVLTGSKTVNYGQTYGTLPIPTRTGYTFEGWYTGASDGTLISATDTVTITNALTVYAHWTAKTPTIVFYANGGNLEDATTTAVYKETYGEMPTPTLAHYTFDGWYTTLTGSTQKKSTTSFTQTGTQILYARWTADIFTVTYDANGGTVSTATKEVTYESSYGTLRTPSRTDYDFLGWYTAASGGRQVTSTTIVTIGKNHTLYAHWKGASCEITFHANGGTVSQTSLTAYLNETYGELPIPTRTGYNFEGWYTGSEAGTLVSATDKVTASGSITLYAHWVAKTLTVTLDANGGEVDTETMTVTYGSSYGELPTPIYKDYNFCGWYVETGAKLITEDTIVDMDDNHKLVAYWDQNTVEIDKSAFTYEEDYGYYCFYDNSIENISGTLSVDISDVTSFTYSITDDSDIVIKSGTIEIAASWTINHFGFMMGMNTLEVKAVLNDKSVLIDKMEIMCPNSDYIDSLDIDTADNDNDGLINYLEDYYGTDMNNADSDGDGLSDYLELAYLGTDPMNTDTDADTILDSDEDYDGDGLSNGYEVQIGTDPALFDTDGDGINDYDELNAYGTNPLSEDTDGDGAKDGWEIEHGYDPLTFNESFMVVKSVTTASSSTVAVSGGAISVVSGSAVTVVSGGAVTVNINLSGDLVDTLSISRVADSILLTDEIPGYIEKALSAIGTHSGQEIGFLASEDTRNHHYGKYGTGTLTDFLSKSVTGWLSIFTGKNLAQYYEFYEVKSVKEYFWITHETDSFYFYLSQGTRRFINP